MKHTKYPRTKHLPWSGSATHDDRFLESTECFNNKQVVVTLKKDGEATSLYSDGSFHARSLDSKADPSRDWLHKCWRDICFSEKYNSLLHSSEGYAFPHHIYKEYAIRFCGENLRAKHTIEYTNLNAYFYLHSIWLGDYCLDWTTTVDIADELSLSLVPVLYQGFYNEKSIRELNNLETHEGMPVEGYVVRLANSILLEDFGSSVAKYVRPNFNVGEKHWFHTQREYNKLKDGIVKENWLSSNNNS